MVKGLQKVVAGQSMGAGFPAATYNAMIDVINAYRRGQLTLQNQNKSASRNSGIVLVKNSTGSDLSRGEVVGLDGPIIGSDVESGGPYWHQISLNGITPTSNHVPDLFAITREAIPSGKIGYATVSGVCQTQVYMYSPQDCCAGCEIGNTTRLSSRTNGGARILWVESTGVGVQNAIVRVGDTPEVGIVLVSGFPGDLQDPVYSWGFNFFDGSVMQWSGQTQACWIGVLNTAETTGKLIGGDFFIAFRIGPYTISGQTRDLYVIRDPNIGKVRVNAGDALDYLEDQFADHQSSPTYTEGHLLVKEETTTSGDDQLIKAFVATTGYTGSEQQSLVHDEDSDALKWVSTGKVKVNTDDTLDFLEDQFADHVASPEYTEGHLLVETQTETTGDQKIRAFVGTTGYDGQAEQALTHAEDSDAPVWVDIVEVDVITNLRIESGKIEKQVSKIKVLSNVDQGWTTGLLATECPEP
jgi:hypothetical protein